MSILIELMPWIGGAIVAVLGYLKIKRSGAEAERRRAQNEDYENAEDIRNSVERDLPERVHEYNDAGYRD